MANLNQQEFLDYSTYNMSAREYFTYGLQGMGIVILIGYFFYRSYCAILVMAPLVFVYIKIKKKELNEKRRKELLLQFKEMLISVNGSVQAGYSIENAFLESVQEMRELYGEKSYIVQELNAIKRGLSNNRQLTTVLSDFARRSGLDDIEDFASVLIIGKKTGGNTNRIMNSYISVIEEKTEVLGEIDTMIASQRFEQRIMNVIPFFIIFYVNLTSKGFFDVLYHNLSGVVIMSVALGIYVLSVYMSARISDIRL